MKVWSSSRTTRDLLDQCLHEGWRHRGDRRRRSRPSRTTRRGLGLRGVVLGTTEAGGSRAAAEAGGSTRSREGVPHAAPESSSRRSLSPTARSGESYSKPRFRPTPGWPGGPRSGEKRPWSPWNRGRWTTEPESRHRRSPSVIDGLELRATVVPQLLGTPGHAHLTFGPVTRPHPADPRLDRPCDRRTGR